MRILSIGRIIGVFAAAMFACGHGAAAGTLRFGGTGAATEMLRHVGAAFSAATEIQVDIIPSLGSSGALRALQEGALDVAVSARPLRPEEKASGLVAAEAIRTAFCLATSQRDPNGLKSTEVAEIFASNEAAWRDGTPIRIILRPKSESDTKLLGDLFPGMAAAIEQARQRTDVPIAATDQDNADFAERVRGSLIGASLTQLKMEKRSLRTIAIDGVEPTMENFESGRYPYTKTMYVVLPAKAAPAAMRFVAYLRSSAGRVLLQETGNLPASN